MTAVSGKGTAGFIVTLDGVDYTVNVEDSEGPPWTVNVNGRPYVVTARDDGLVLVDGIAHEVEVEGETVRFEGTTYRLRVSGFDLGPVSSDSSPGPASPRQSAGGDGAILAIMPGQVTRILVEEGEQVAEGKAICVLEAMKMENELRADRDGVVTKIHVRPGEDVEKDQVLVEFE